jgi:superfamily II DNA or RNA helicase
LEEFQSWVDEFFEGKDFQPRDYQVEAAWKIVKYRYSVSEIATSSGKTLISFMIFAFLKQRGLIRKFLMIVPSTNLVFQGNDDFIDYGVGELGIRIQQIGGGSKMREDCELIIGTFQSLVKKDEDFFEEIDAVFVDEAHHAFGKALAKGLAMQAGDWYNAKLVEDTIDQLSETAGAFGYAFANQLE